MSSEPQAPSLQDSLPQQLADTLRQLGVALNPLLKQTAFASLQQRAGLPAAHVVVAFSGGLDSAVLLDALGQLSEQYALKVTAAYYNHGWRTPPRELPILHKLTEAHRIPLVIIDADKTVAQTEGAAREHRYPALCALAGDLQADALLTAHHADDQVETVLFRMLRGTGVEGLRGIQHTLRFAGCPVPVLRPMLGLSRYQLEHYAKARNLAYFSDPANQALHHQRSLLRQKVIPFLEEHFPNVRQSLYKMAILAEGDQKIIDDSINGLWQQVYLSDEKGYYLDATVFNQLDLPYQRQVIKRYFTLSGLAVDFQRIEDTLAFIRGENRNDLNIGLKSLGRQTGDRTSGGEDGRKPERRERFLSLYKNRIRILALKPDDLHQSDAPKAEAETSVTVPIPGRAWSESLKLSVEIAPIGDEGKAKLSKPSVLRASALLDPNVAYVDLSLFIDSPERLAAPKPLELRTRRPGDKFFPMGMENPMRLKKYLINKAIPRFERDTLPLLASGEHVLWIPGLGLSDYVKVNGKPTHRIQIEQRDTPPPEPTEEIAAAENAEAEAAADAPKIPLAVSAERWSDIDTSEPLPETDDDEPDQAPTAEENAP